MYKQAQRAEQRSCSACFSDKPALPPSPCDANLLCRDPCQRAGPHHHFRSARRLNLFTTHVHYQPPKSCFKTHAHFLQRFLRICKTWANRSAHTPRGLQATPICGNSVSGSDHNGQPARTAPCPQTPWRTPHALCRTNAATRTRVRMRCKYRARSLQRFSCLSHKFAI